MAIPVEGKQTEEPKEELIRYLADLEEVVGRMSSLYDRHPDLNAEIDIEDVIPMSLDEWECELRTKIYNLEMYKDEEAEVDEEPEFFSLSNIFGVGTHIVDGEEVKCGFPQDEY